MQEAVAVGWAPHRSDNGIRRIEIEDSRKQHAKAPRPAIGTKNITDLTTWNESRNGILRIN